MGELRKDYLLDRWVIIATERGKRPHQFKQEQNEEKPETDFFAPGNEDMTPEETYRKGEEEWSIRAFPNKFPAVNPEGDSRKETHNDYYTFADAYGYHEVIVETATDNQLWDLSEEEITDVLEAYRNRYEELKQKEGVEYVQIFKNHGKAAGTSIVHSHSQLVAYNHLPSVVRQEREVCREQDHYGRIIEREKDSERRCFENDYWIAFTPYASRFPFEILILPKEMKKTLEECDLSSLADMMKQVLGRLKELNAPFNYMLHYGSNNDQLRFHIEIIPRLSTWAGFEFNGTIINTMSPENAAAFYRGED